MLFVLARNISDLAEVSDYDVSVAINDRTIWRGEVKGHHRSDGWRALLRLISNAEGKSLDGTPLVVAAVSGPGVAARTTARLGETLCEHGERPYECWTCRSCHPVD
jgi:hypothetical protein